MILHLVPAPFGEDGVYGGAERYAFELAKAMSKRVKTKLLSFADKGRITIHSCGLEEVVLGNPWHVRGQRLNPIHLGMFPHFWAAKIIHCHQTHVLSSEFAALFGRLTNKKVFTTDHGGGGWCLNAYIKTGNIFSQHLFVSDYSKRQNGFGFESKHKVIFGGVDHDKFKPNAMISKEKRVVFVGRLLPHKGIGILLQSIPPGVALEVIGRPFSFEYVEHLKALAEGKNVIFRFDCTDSEIIEAYQRACCVVLPSIERDETGRCFNQPELLGQTLLEAMSCGTAVICSDVGGMPEIVEHGISGWVIPSGNTMQLTNKIKMFVDNPLVAEEFGKKSRQIILDKFCWQSIVSRCFESYGVV